MTTVIVLMWIALIYAYWCDYKWYHSPFLRGEISFAVLLLAILTIWYYGWIA